MEQWTGSKLTKEYIKAVYCHPAYLTYMEITSCEMLGWMKHKLESRLLGEGRRIRRRQRVRLLDGITNSIDMSLSKLEELVMDREALHAALHGVAKNWTQLSYDKPIQSIKKQRLYFAKEGPYGQSYGFSSSHVWI